MYKGYRSSLNCSAGHLPVTLQPLKGHSGIRHLCLTSHEHGVFDMLCLSGSYSFSLAKYVTTPATSNEDEETAQKLAPVSNINAICAITKAITKTFIYTPTNIYYYMVNRAAPICYNFILRGE